MMVAIYNVDLFVFYFSLFVVFFSDGKSTVTMEDILIFATGCKSIPPAGFKPNPSIECLHMDFPVGNKCDNCLALPITSTYKEFQESMDFAIKNTLGRTGLIVSDSTGICAGPGDLADRDQARADPWL